MTEGASNDSGDENDGGVDINDSYDANCGDGMNKSDFGDDANDFGGNSNDDDGVIVKKVSDT